MDNAGDQILVINFVRLNIKFFSLQLVKFPIVPWHN